MNKHYFTHADLLERARQLVPDPQLYAKGGQPLRVYPIPRGGVPAAYLLKAASEVWAIHICANPQDADVFVDDIIDSGATMERYCDQYPGIPFLALVDKTDPADAALDWVVFPWEETDAASAEEDIVRRMLQVIGEDPDREGLRDTPKRVLKAWRTWFGGYGKDVAQVMKVFEDGADGCDEMVLVKDIPVFSHCEHHIAPILGVAHVAYIPNGKILGLSKIARVVDIFARRLQVQERLTNNIADALQEHLEPLGVAVVITAEHTCMTTRGVQIAGGRTTTSAMRGAFRDNPETRAEYMGLIK